MTAMSGRVFRESEKCELLANTALLVSFSIVLSSCVVSVLLCVNAMPRMYCMEAHTHSKSHSHLASSKLSNS